MPHVLDIWPFLPEGATWKPVETSSKASTEMVHTRTDVYQVFAALNGAMISDSS